MKNSARLGRETARDFPGIEASDIEHEIMVTGAEQIIKYPGRWELASEPLRATMLRQFGRAYAADEIRESRIYDAKWTYMPAEVVALLDAAFDEEIRNIAPQKDQSLWSLEGENLAIPLMDIDNALTKLTDKQKTVVLKRHVYHETLDGAAERMLYSRAVDKICNYLNTAVHVRYSNEGDHEGPGARKAQTNAEAFNLTNEWN